MAASTSSNKASIRCGLLAFATALTLCGAAGYAQNTMLPPACAGMTGEQLDRCVRDITLPQITPKLEPIEAKPDPAQLVNCLTTVRADEDFCIARNEIVLECRNRAKYPDFEQCANSLVMAQPRPPVANCVHAAPARRNQCELRNKVFAACTDDPLRYFICLAEKMNAKSQ
jgi:hypothetical protein